MLCPECKTEMEHGESYVHGSVLGWVMAGFAYQHCYFKTAATNKPIPIIKSPQTNKAWRCANCSLVIIKENNASSS